MPLKKLTVSFDIDHELFARMLMHAGRVRFEAFGTDDDSRPPAQQAAPLLGVHPNGGANGLILDQLSHSAVPLTAAQLRPRLLDAGYAVGTVNTALNVLKARGHIRRLKKGYVATARAMEGRSNGQA